MTTITETKTTATIDNSYFFALAVSPIFGFLTDRIVEKLVIGMRTDKLFILQTVVSLVIYVALCYADTRRCRESGFEPNWVAGLIFVPLYIFHRIKVTNTGFAPLLVWCACFAVALSLVP